MKANLPSLLFSFFVLFSISSYSQTDTAYYQDFSNGFPKYWTLFDANYMDYNWYWSDDPAPGIEGLFSANNDTFRAQSAWNGYIMISGDIYNSGSTSNPIMMNAYFQTPPMDFSEVSASTIEWSQYFRYCCNYSTIKMEFGISEDGNNWSYRTLHGTVIPNDYSSNPNIKSLNITSEVAGKSKIYFRWYLRGASHYFWAIDDILIKTTGEVIAITEQEINNTSIHVFPNPSNKSINISLESNQIGEVLQIYNSLGQIVESMVIQNTSFVLNTSHYAKGIYYMRTTSSKIQFIIE